MKAANDSQQPKIVKEVTIKEDKPCKSDDMKIKDKNKTTTSPPPNSSKNESTKESKSIKDKKRDGDIKSGKDNAPDESLTATSSTKPSATTPTKSGEDQGATTTGPDGKPSSTSTHPHKQITFSTHRPHTHCGEWNPNTLVYQKVNSVIASEDSESANLNVFYELFTL